MKKHVFIFFLLCPILVRSLSAVSPYYSERLTNFHSFRYIYSMSQSQDKTYFATNNGLIVYSHIFKAWEKPMNRPLGLPDRDIRTVYYHHATGYLWAASESELYVLYAESAFQWEKTGFSQTISRLGSLGERLFAEVQTGIEEVDPHRGSVIENEELPKNKIDWSVSGIDIDLYQVQFTGEYIIDSDASVVQNAFVKYPIAFSVYGIYQNLWMGTLGNGLYTGDRTMKIVRHTPYGLLNNNVTKCMVWDDKIYIGHKIDYHGEDDRNGWTECNEEFQVFQWIDEHKVPVLGNQAVRGFILNRDTLITVTDHSIIVSEPQRDGFKTITPGVGMINSVKEVVQDDQAGWIMAETGLFLIELSDLSIRPVLQTPARLLTGLRMGDKLYLGTFSGLRMYSVTDSLSLNHEKNYIDIRYAVDNLAGNGEHIFWNDDYFVMSATPDLSELKRIPITEFSRGIVISDIVCSKTMLFIGTNRGLYTYNLNTEQISRISTDEGMCSNKIQTLELSEDVLYIGTDKGLTLYEFNK
jgi:uncharacterized pyridoxamine 5'-phosphate oxidase family protein